MLFCSRERVFLVGSQKLINLKIDYLTLLKMFKVRMQGFMSIKLLLLRGKHAKNDIDEW